MILGSLLAQIPMRLERPEDFAPIIRELTGLDIAASDDDDINWRYKLSAHITKHMPNSSLDSIPSNSPLL